MIVSVTGFSKRVSVCLLALAIAVPAAAQDSTSNARDREPDLQRIATTPIRDLNLTRDPIPAVLIRANEAPYDANGLRRCRDIGAAIAELDAVLGPDIDVAAEERDRISVGRIAQSAVGSLIPFRSIVRELSGAADHRRAFEEAIYAGSIRRGFLKGLGQQRGCAYPARPAYARVRVTSADRTDTAKGRERAAMKEERAEDGTLFVSEPVVQPTGQ
ncbi:MAG: hypothetical protein ACK4GD_10630 [Sphingomonadaceae bacterium]